MTTMTKQELRNAMKKKVIVRRDDRSINILKRLLEHPRFLSASSILLYASLPHEVDTGKLVTICLKTKTVVALPKVDSGQQELRLYQVRSLQDLSPGAFGITEPLPEREVLLEDIDLAIIPGIAFTRSGQRLGRGKGYYDKLLAGRKGENPYTVGLAFEEQIVENLPRMPHDVDLDLIITG